MKTTDDFLESWSDAEDEMRAKDAKARAYLDKHAERLKKGSAWWVSPHNFLLNQALMGMNGWVFVQDPKILSRDGVDGLSVRPTWTSLKQGGALGPLMSSGGFSYMDLDTAKRLVKFAKSRPSVAATTADAFAGAEQKAGKEIPRAIKEKLIKSAPKVAARRWGVNRLKIRRQFFPFDGSKPVYLSNWE